MNRRSLLSLIASLPIVGSFVKEADGVALRSTSHPVGVDTIPQDSDGYLLDESSITSTEISLTPYATAGELVTCENGHPICQFVVDVFVGQFQDLKHQLGQWLQEEPLIGQTAMPVCKTCGGSFYKAGGVFHFEDGWRYYDGPSLFRSRPR